MSGLWYSFGQPKDMRTDRQGKRKLSFRRRGFFYYLRRHGLQKILDDAPPFNDAADTHYGVRLCLLEMGGQIDLIALASESIFPSEDFGRQVEKYFLQAPDWTLRFLQECRRIYSDRYNHPIDWALLVFDATDSMTDDEIRYEIKDVLGKSVETSAIAQQRRRLKKWLDRI